MRPSFPRICFEPGLPDDICISVPKFQILVSLLPLRVKFWCSLYLLVIALWYFGTYFPILVHISPFWNIPIFPFWCIFSWRSSSVGLSWRPLVTSELRLAKLPKLWLSL
jgi:hypothetical protein